MKLLLKRFTMDASYAMYVTDEVFQKKIFL